ncbi:MAG: hypothetical protein R2828_13850 [Saprospiraceae bacterium]
MANKPLFSKKDLKSLPLGFQLLVDHKKPDEKSLSQKEILEKVKVLEIEAYHTKHQSPSACWKPISKIALV